jgi:anti-anti-sigma regulatory factor
MDAQVAAALLRSAQAVRMLGAQLVLTGISTQMAQALVHLGVDLSALITRGSLQGGITYAFGALKRATNGVTH